MSTSVLANIFWETRKSPNTSQQSIWASLGEGSVSSRTIHGVDSSKNCQSYQGKDENSGSHRVSSKSFMVSKYKPAKHLSVPGGRMRQFQDHPWSWFEQELSVLPRRGWKFWLAPCLFQEPNDRQIQASKAFRAPRGRGRRWFSIVEKCGAGEKMY